MDLLSVFFLVLLGSAIGVVGILLVIQHRHLQVVRDLCDLRENVVEIQRGELKVKTSIQFALARELDDTIHTMQRFYRSYQRLREAPAKEQDILYGELRKANAINEDLENELSKILIQNQTLEEKVSNLKEQERRVEAVMAANFELRAKMQKIEARNIELEYAINLESISMIEDYDARDKLYSAIDDVRRSLTRILTTAEE